MLHEAKTHYELLGIPRTASAEQIRRAYREKMKEAHPDKLAANLFEAHASGDEAIIATVRREIARAEEQAKHINQAYSILSDPAKRRRYDLDLRHIEVRARRSTASTYTRSSEGPPRTSSRPSSRTSSAGPRGSSSSRSQSRASSGRHSGRTRPRSYARAQTTPPRPLEDRLSVFATSVFLMMMVAAIIATGSANNKRTRSTSGAIRMPQPVTPTISARQVSRATRTALFDRISAETQLTYEGQLFDLGDAEGYFERGFDYLAQSNEPGDQAEQLAVLNFLYATVMDPEYRFAYRMLGELFYDRWRSSTNADDRQMALMHLSRYESLTDGPVDSEVRSMLAALG